MTTETQTTTGGLRPALGVGTMFASNGAVFAALLPWYPIMVDRLHLSPAEFGFVVASFAVGALVSSALPAPLIARFGPVRVAVVGTVLLAAAIASAAWAPSAAWFAVAIFLAGFFDAVVDVAQNVAGIRVQDAVGRSILSSMHALWSLGGVASGALSTAAAASGLSMRGYLVGVAVVCVGLVALGGVLIGPWASAPEQAPEPADDAPARGRVWRTALLAALPLVVIAICGTMVEDVANNWAALAGVRIGGLSVGVAGLAFTVTIGSQCVGRFTGDLLIHRFGRSRVAFVGGVLIAVGGLVVVTAHSPAVLFVGLALAGYGSATLVPSALTAAARLPGVSQGAGVTIVSWLMRVGFLVTSPIIGSIAGAVGLRWGLCTLVVVGVAAVALSGALRERRTVN
ncbi:MFS transporter [Luteimicrobium subarcticum]|uniref:MFS transporter n=1 Tax=Luteimicrobium subarcticum TaxID=620910 RepID=UPI001FEBCA1A|nr:MFS transporter [Luteimicrobium subarcticum]